METVWEKAVGYMSPVRAVLLSPNAPSSLHGRRAAVMKANESVSGARSIAGVPVQESHTPRSPFYSLYATPLCVNGAQHAEKARLPQICRDYSRLMLKFLSDARLRPWAPRRVRTLAVGAMNIQALRPHAKPLGSFLLSVCFPTWLALTPPNIRPPLLSKPFHLFSPS